MAINDPFKAYPNSDLQGRYIHHEVARPAGLFIYKLQQDVAQEVVQQAEDIQILSVWSDSDLLAVYADVEPVWAYNSHIPDAIFCPAFSTTVIESNAVSSLWLIPISVHLVVGGEFTVTLQQMQAWKALGQDPQLSIIG
jgi:hypothetical protein